MTEIRAWACVVGPDGTVYHIEPFETKDAAEEWCAERCYVWIDPVTDDVHPLIVEA